MSFLAVNPPNEDELLEMAAATSSGTAAAAAAELPLVQRVGLLAVRGAEIVEVRDEEGGLMNDFTGRVRLDERKPPKGECEAAPLVSWLTMYIARVC